MDIYRELTSSARAPIRDMRTDLVSVGQVISIDPIQVRLFGDSSGSTSMQSLLSYSPSVGDKVLAVKVGLQWIVLGAYSGSGVAAQPAPIGWQTPQWVTGNIYSAHYQGIEGTSSLTLDRIYFVPYTHSHGTGRAIDAIVVANTATDVSNHKVGLYASNVDGLPGGLLDSAESALDSTYKEFALAADVTLQPHTTYWLAWHLGSTENSNVVDSTTNYPLYMFNLGSATASTALTGEVQGRFYYSQSYASGLPDPFPDPSTWTAETLAGSQFPLMGVRAA